LSRLLLASRAQRIYLLQVIKEMIGGGADYCFEYQSWRKHSVALGWYDSFFFFPMRCSDCQPNFCRDPSTTLGWSKTVILGTDGNVKPLSISSSDIKRGRSIHGALLGGIKPKDDIPDTCWQTSIWTR
jgi:S-(hydroxymethyl)glutathione dehydrogenase / alcohol dehydrogenase